MVVYTPRVPMFCSRCVARNLIEVGDMRDEHKCWRCNRQTKMVPASEVKRCNDCRQPYVLGRIDGYCRRCTKQCEECGQFFWQKMFPVVFTSLVDRRRNGRSRICQQCLDQHKEERLAVVDAQHRYVGKPGEVDF